MNTSKFRSRAKITAAGLCVVLTVGGCTLTRSRRSAPQESGFLGDYSQLQKNPDYSSALVYVKPGVDWSRYKSIQIDSVGLWGNETTKLTPEAQQQLTDTLYKSLYGALGESFVIADHPGPNTLRLRVALTQAQGAKVALRTVTTVIPQLRTAGKLVGLAGDTATTVASATVEMEALDSVTNQRLAAAVDERAGNKVLFAKSAYTTWGDVDVACELWSKRLAWRLAHMGVQLKPGATMPEEPKESRTF